MPFKYKMDVIDALKKAGYSTYRIRKEKLFSESTLQAFRDNKMVSWDTLDTICHILNCQPGEIVEYTPDNNSGEI